MKEKHTHHYWHFQKLETVGEASFRFYSCKTCGKEKRQKVRKAVSAPQRRGKQPSESKKSVQTPAKPRKGLKRVSEKRQKMNKIYMDMRELFLKEHPICQCKIRGMGHIRCGQMTTEVHHVARRGKNFLNMTTWLATCFGCHTDIEANPSWAKSQGYLESHIA